MTDGSNLPDGAAIKAYGDTNWAGGGASDIDGLSDAVTTATSNIGLGSTAIDSITTGDYNVGLGDNAGTAITEGDDNTIMGYNAGAAITTSSKNVIIGFEAMKEFSSASHNGSSVAIGYKAMSLGSHDNVSGNTVIGCEAFVDSGSQQCNSNVVIGFHAGGYTTTATASRDNSVVIGVAAGADWLGSGGVVLIGASAGKSLTTGNYNVCVGETAGYGVTTGINNLLLGRQAGQPQSPVTVTTDDNNICLGNSSHDDFYCADSSISTSDERDKTDIETFTHGLDFVNQMRPVTFRWDKRSWYCEESEDEEGNVISITDEDVANAVPDGTHKRAEIRLGFIGQEVQAIEQQYGYSQIKDDGTPDEDTELIVDTVNDGLKMGLQYAKVVPILVNAIKELSAKVEVLENA
jgi:hypothetical protein